MKLNFIYCVNDPPDKRYKTVYLAKRERERAFYLALNERLNGHNTATQINTTGVDYANSTSDEAR